VKQKRDRCGFQISLAKKLWRGLPQTTVNSLRSLVSQFGISISNGDIRLISGHLYLTHVGLLSIAQRRRCASITTSLQTRVSDAAASRWVFRATVYKSSRSKGFVGYGDADPNNVSPLVRGAEMRVAETRAVNRALRKAYGIGICSVEELGSYPFSQRPRDKHAAPPIGNRHSNGQPSLRDKLCLLVRNYELDPTLVKRYAADFCGTETLREASRDLVEAFVSTISEEAANNRAALVCKLNSYNQPEEVRP
jgi:hypothetical protein